MKHRLSITLDEAVVLKLKEAVRVNQSYKNQSHFVEEAIRLKLDDQNVNQ